MTPNLSQKFWDKLGQHPSGYLAMTQALASQMGVNAKSVPKGALANMFWDRAGTGVLQCYQYVTLSVPKNGEYCIHPRNCSQGEIKGCYAVQCLYGILSGGVLKLFGTNQGPAAFDHNEGARP